MSDSGLSFENTPAVPFSRLVQFVRQVTHDVRNGLNAIDLQASFISEIAGEREVGDEMVKLRRMVTHVTDEMQILSGRFGELRPIFMDFPLQEFIQGLKEAVDREFETQARRIVWDIRAGDEEIPMDFSLLTNALIEIIRNAIYFREGDHPIHFSAWNDRSTAFFEVRQTRSQPSGNPATWGCVPLDSSRRGGYGLGLFYVRRILDNLCGSLEPVYDTASGELRVRLTLPAKRAAPKSGPVKCTKS